MGLVQKLNNITFSGSLPKLEKDPLANDGTILIYDFLNTGCWDGEDPSDSNNIVKDLSRNENDGTVIDPTAGAIFNNGFDFAAGDTYITLPSLALTGKSLLITIWYEWRSAQAASAAGIAGNLENDLSGGQFGFWCGTGSSDQLKGRIRDDIGNLPTGWDDVIIGTQDDGFIIQSALSVTIAGSDSQFVSYEHEEGRDLRKDSDILTVGAQGLNTDSSIAIGALNGSGDRTGYRGRFLRMSIEDIGVSGGEPLQILQDDWDINFSRFNI